MEELRCRRTIRRLKRETGFDPAASHEIVVPAGPGERPGERVMAPSRSAHPPRLTPDRAREDFRVIVGRGGSSLAAVCLGPVNERGDPDSSVEYSLNSIAGRLGDPEVGHRLPDAKVAGIHALRYRIRLPSATLDEWKFAHDGWLYVAGVLWTRPDRENDVLATGQRVLDTWTWLPSRTDASE